MSKPVIPVCPHCRREVRPPANGKPYSMIAYRPAEGHDIGYYHDDCFKSAENKKAKEAEQQVIIDDLLTYLPKKVVMSLTDKRVTGYNRMKEEKEWVLITKSLHCDDHYSMQTFESKEATHAAVLELVNDEYDASVGIYKNRVPVYFKSEVVVEIDETVLYGKIEE